MSDPALDFYDTVSPDAVTTYLGTSGWTETCRFEGRLSVWSKKDKDGDEFDIVIPLRTTFHDYSVRMKQCIAILRVVENRSEETILKSIADPSKSKASELPANSTRKTARVIPWSARLAAGCFPAAIGLFTLPLVDRRLLVVCFALGVATTAAFAAFCCHIVWQQSQRLASHT